MATAEPICSAPRTIRPPHLPVTTSVRLIGADARRRSNPCMRSVTSIELPLVNSTSNVNMTRIPGMACSNPVGMICRCPAAETSSCHTRVSLFSSTSDAADRFSPERAFAVTISASAVYRLRWIRMTS